MYLPPICHMIGICVTRALRYLINSFACVILNNKFTPRSSELSNFSIATRDILRKR